MAKLDAQTVTIVIRAEDQSGPYTGLFHCVGNDRGDRKEDCRAFRSLQHPTMEHGKKDKEQYKPMFPSPGRTTMVPWSPSESGI